MKLACLIAVLTFGALPGLRATPIDLTATNLDFSCGNSGGCGIFGISGPGFDAQMYGSGAGEPGVEVELDLDGQLGSTLTVGNTTYGADSIIATGPAVIAFMTSTTVSNDEWSASGPATATGEISVCLVSAVPDLNCDAGLAFAIINLPGLSGTFNESWEEDPGGDDLDGLGGSLSATIIPEPSTVGIAFAGLLLLVASGKWQSKHRRALRDRVTGAARV